MMIKKIIFVISLFLFVITVCYAQNFNIKSFIDAKNGIATIDISENEKNDNMSESDMLVELEESVLKAREAGCEKIILRLNSGNINEESVAKLIDGIDVVIAFNKIGENKKIGDTIIVYEPSFEEDNDAIIDSDKNTSNPVSSISNMLVLTLVVLAIVIFLYFIIKRFKNNKNSTQ